MADPVNAQESSVQIQVWRNHMFETVASIGSFFGSYMGVNLSFTIRDYDDSFSFLNWSPHALEILWLDPSRYESKMSASELELWIRERVLALRSLTMSPILVLGWNPGLPKSDTLEAYPTMFAGVQFVDIQNEFTGNPKEFLDSRLAALAGSNLSAKTQLLLGRKLGLQWVPALSKPPIKVVILDLDNTLYSGVLGEDGPLGIT